MVNLEDIKLPPHSIEAEKGIISGALLDNETMWIFENDRLNALDFYKKEHAFIYQAIQDLWKDHKTIDIITVTDELKKANHLDTVGGTEYLYEISNFLLSTSSCKDYSKIVKEKAILRSILKVSQKIIGDAYEEKNTQEILTDIEKKIFDLSQFATGKTMKDIGDILKERIDEYMQIIDNPEKINEKKVFSWYKSLDHYISGFKPGELIIVAARPSMGKTAFATNILTNVALEQHKAVVFISLEMSSASIVDRIISEVATIPMTKITKNTLTEEDFANMGDAFEVLGEAKIYIDDRGWLNIPVLKSQLRRLKIEKWGLDLVVVDYLQLMHATQNVGNRVQEISEISRGLKEVAKELEIPIIALSQLSRAVEQRVDKKPQLSDLRESGAIEQDADCVIMLHREEYYDKETERKGATDICIRKNRNGAVGEVELHFEEKIMKFIEKKERREE